MRTYCQSHFVYVPVFGHESKLLISVFSPSRLFTKGLSKPHVSSPYTSSNGRRMSNGSLIMACRADFSLKLAGIISPLFTRGEAALNHSLTGMSVKNSRSVAVFQC